MTRRVAVPLVVAAALGLAGCGSAGSTAASRPNPPAPIALSAFVGRGAVRVSPARLGAGPVLLTVVNGSSRATVLTVGRSGERVVARSAPINPEGVTQIKVDLSPGSYGVTATDAGSRSDAARARAAAAAVTTTLRVGPSRAGGGDQVLQP